MCVRPGCAYFSSSPIFGDVITKRVLVLLPPQLTSKAAIYAAAVAVACIRQFASLCPSILPWPSDQSPARPGYTLLKTYKTKSLFIRGSRRVLLLTHTDRLSFYGLCDDGVACICIPERRGPPFFVCIWSCSKVDFYRFGETCPKFALFFSLVFRLKRKQKDQAQAAVMSSGIVNQLKWNNPTHVIWLALYSFILCQTDGCRSIALVVLHARNGSQRRRHRRRCLGRATRVIRRQSPFYSLLLDIFYFLCTCPLFYS